MALGYMPSTDTVYLCPDTPPHSCNWPTCEMGDEYVFDETRYDNKRRAYFDKMHFKYPHLTPKELDEKIEREAITFVL